MGAHAVDDARANENYKGDLKPSFNELVIRFIGDSQAQVTALQNGEVDIISPQASGDTLTALEGIDGVTVNQGDELSYDHLDLTFAGPLADQNVREAFLKTIPRQQLVDTLIKPVNPDAEVLNSQLFIPAQAATRTRSRTTAPTPTPRSTSRAPRRSSPVRPRRSA